MRTPGILLLSRLGRSALRGLGYALFQLVLVLLYGLHLTRAFGSPFRTGAGPPPTRRAAHPPSLSVA